ncbi:MAG: copper chaperone PCu(A)C [Rhodobacteraceae bacterium]|nr:copper chaperone PCu(A)C [Paracoccaceae bacterium]
MRLTSIFLALALAASSAIAHDIQVGDLEIIHPAIPLPPPSAPTAAGYMAIANNGTHPDRLIGVEVPIAKSSSLHRTEVSADGVARMLPLEAADIPADDTVLFEQGAMHVMLMGLSAPLHEGDMVPATLIFQHAGRVEVEFMVDPADGMDHGTMDHGAMDHSAMGHAQADGPMSVMGGTDAEQIEALLKAQFERPEAPLTVAPITVQGSVAVAGWSQDGNGGRAFLRKDDHGWFVELCSGESLVLPATFQSMGLGHAEANRLAASVNGAETSAGADLIARLNAFEGTVIIGRQGMGDHGHGHNEDKAHGH